MPCTRAATAYALLTVSGLQPGQQLACGWRPCCLLCSLRVFLRKFQLFCGGLLWRVDAHAREKAEEGLQDKHGVRRDGRKAVAGVEVAIVVMMV